MDVPLYRRPSWKHPAALACAALLVVFAVVFVTRWSSTSDASRLERFYPGSCGRVGVIAFAGGRSALYQCATVEQSLCAVWASGSAYDVTRQARSVFRLSGRKPPC